MLQLTILVASRILSSNGSGFIDSLGLILSLFELLSIITNVRNSGLIYAPLPSNDEEDLVPNKSQVMCLDPFVFIITVHFSDCKHKGGEEEMELWG